MLLNDLWRALHQSDHAAVALPLARQPRECRHPLQVGVEVEAVEHRRAEAAAAAAAARCLRDAFPVAPPARLERCLFERVAHEVAVAAVVVLHAHQRLARRQHHVGVAPLAGPNHVVQQQVV
eukprot:313515-Chlamydomonas_euryale.AAC.1